MLETAAKKSAPEEKKTIKVYLVQHGNVVSKEINPERPLSDKGRKDVEKIAGLLKKIKLNVNVIQHSEELRATQTAEILHSTIKSIRDIVQKNNLAPNDPIEPLWYEIMKAHEDLLIVGHLPFLSRLASRLLSGKAD